jgi:NADPH:quinone reductase-like Zn-dependent oxidoreductase
MADNENMKNPSSTSDIKAIILQQTFTGKREFKVTTIPKPPPPSDSEVLISVKAW